MRKIIILFQSITLIFILSSVTVGKSISEDSISIENVRFSSIDGKIIINYDFKTKTDIDYNIRLLLKRAGDPNFLYEPKMISGKIGSESSSGMDQEIVWEILKEQVKTFSGNDYYFVVTAYKNKSRSKLLYWLGGGVALLGGGAAVLLSGKKSTTIQNTNTYFPVPGGRPNN